MHRQWILHKSRVKSKDSGALPELSKDGQHMQWISGATCSPHPTNTLVMSLGAYATRCPAHSHTFEQPHRGISWQHAWCWLFVVGPLFLCITQAD